MSAGPVRRETSAGVIVFHDAVQQGRLWLVLKHRQGHWGFPKGHVERGETLRQTALRELHEEAGIEAGQVELTDGFSRSIRYRFAKKGGRTVAKTVHYLLGRSRTRQVQPGHPGEQLDWLPLDECLARLTHASARHLLADAVAFLGGATGKRSR